jgi:protocatechuate 3,4-dioxygenase beta subunit
MTLRPVLNSARAASPLALLLWWLAAIAVLPSGISVLAADTDDSGNKRWTPAELADGVEAAIARVTSSELSTRYIELRNTNAYGKGDAVFASGTGRSLFRADGTRWYCDDDGFTTRMTKSEVSPVRVESGFDGLVHFEKNRHIVTYGEDNLSVWQYSPKSVFWGGGRDTDFLLGRLRDENAKVVSDETVDGRRQVTVEDAWSWGETAYEYQVTLLPDHSFLPVEATVTVNGNPDAEWSASGLKQTDGLWYPSKVSRKRFVGKKPDRDKRTIVTAFRLRDDFDDAEFQLGSTISLDIVDRRTGTAFHNAPWWHDMAPFLRQRLDWPKRDMHSANDYAKYGNDDLVGKPAPKLSVAEWINGEPTAITAEGRHLTLLVFFGGRAISPSPRTLAALNNLRDVYHKHGLEVIGVASHSDTLDATSRDVKSLQLDFPVAIDSPNDDPDGNRYGKTFQAYGLRSYYGFFLIDGDGKVLKTRPSKDLLSDIGKKPGIGGDSDLRTNIIRVLYDAGKRELAFGDGDIFELDLPQIRVIEPEWKRLLKEAPRTAKLTGTLTDGESPIAGATIQATPSFKVLFSYSPGGYFGMYDRDQRFTFKTDDEGHFDAGGLPKGVWQLLITKPGHASMEKNVTLETAESAVELNVENSQKDRIFGRVLDQNGDPVVRANVKVDKRHPDPKRPAITTTAHLPKQVGVTDEEGRFEITHLYDGTYTLVVNAANFESATEPHVSADGKEVVIRLKPRATNTSRAGSLAPFAGFAQVAEQKPEESRSSETDGFPTTGTVTGTVVDENGKPIAKALAVLETHSTRTPDRSPVQVTAVSDKQGRFALSLTERFFQRALQETALKGRIDCPLTLWSKGRPIERRIVTLRKTLAWQANAGHIPLLSGTNVAFRVLSPNGIAVRSAEVKITGQYPGDHPHIPVALQEAMARESDKDGLVLFPGLLRTRTRAVFVVSYRAEEFGTQTAQFQIVTPPEHPLDLAFEAGGTVTGKIRCSDPEQLADLKLELTTEMDARIGFRLGLAIVRRNSSTVTVRPDSDGQFTIKGLTPGLLRVRQISTDEKSWRLKLLPVTQTVEVGAVTEFSAELVPTVPIEGFIVDKQTGEPLTESTVEVTSVNSPQNWAAPKIKVPLTVRPDGSFIGAVIPGKYQVSVRTMVPGFSRIKVAHVTVPADADTAEVKVFIPRTLSMQAELVDEDGLPVGNAWVAAMSGKKLLMLKRASDIGIFEAWLADVSRADHWQVRIGKQRLSGTVINKVPLKLQVALKTEADDANR